MPIEPSLVTLTLVPRPTELLPLTVTFATMAVEAPPLAMSPQPIATLCAPAEGLVQLAGLVYTPLPTTVCANAACGVMATASGTLTVATPPSMPSPNLLRFTPSTRCARRSTAISRRRCDQLPPPPPGIQLPAKPVWRDLLVATSTFLMTLSIPGVDRGGRAGRRHKPARGASRAVRIRDDNRPAGAAAPRRL